MESQEFRLHLLGRGDTDERQREREHVADGVARGEAGAGELGIDGTALARKDLARLVEAMEAAGELLGEVREAERRAVAGTAGDKVPSSSEILRESASSVGSVSSA